MANDIVVPVPRTVVVEEPVGFTLRDLKLQAGTPSTPATVDITLGALNDEGEWRTDVAPLTIHFQDHPESEDPALKYEASAILNLMFTAIVSQTPEHQAQGVAGETVWDAAKILAPDKLAAAMSGPEGAD